MQKITNYRHEIIWFLFLISLPFSKAAANVTLLLGLFVFFYDVIKNKSFLVKPNSAVLLFFIVVVFMAVNALLKAPFSDNQSFFKLYPIIIASYFVLSNIPPFKINSIKILSVISCTIYVGVCLLKMLQYYSGFNLNPFGNSNAINDILFIERPYTACFVLLNIFLCFNLIRITTKKNIKLLYTGLCFLFLCFIILIAARLAILTFIILVIIYLTFYSKYNIAKKLLALFILPLICIVMVYSSKGLQQRLFINESIEVFKDYEPRFIIWNEAFQNFKSKENDLLFGNGNYKEIQTNLVQGYEKIEKEDKRNFYVKEKFNTHNQFLDILLFGGILALLLYVIAIFLQLFKLKNNFTAFSIFFSLVLFMLVENIFHRQTGCYLFTIYLVMALKINENSDLEKPLCK